MAVRVAELESVFTADIKPFEQDAKVVETRRKELDGQTATVPIDADAAAAERTFDEVVAELRAIDEAQTRPKLEADITDAQRELERLRFELDQVDGERPEPEVLADVSDALKELDRAERALADLDDEVAKPRVDTQGLDDFKDEAGSTAREAAASFDGSAESAADAFQEVAANAFTGFGPAGAVAGIAAAAGLGIALAKLTEISEETNAAAEAGAEWSQSFNAADQTGRVEALRDAWSELAAEVRDSREVWELWQDDAVTAVEQIAAAAELAGEDVSAFMSAFEETDPTQRLAELEEALASVRAEEERYEQLREEAAAHWDTKESRNLGAKRDVLGDLGDIIEEEAAKQEAANRIEEANAEALGLSVAAYREHVEVTQAAAEAQAAYSEALEATADPVSVYEEVLARKEEAEQRTAEKTAEATEDATDSWQDYAKDVKVSTQDLIDEWNRQAEEAAAFEDNLAIIAANGGQALADELRAKGPEVAGAVADTIAKAGPKAQQKAINAHARASGAEISSDMADGVSDNGWRLQRAVNGVIRAVKPGEIPVTVSATWSPSQLDQVIANMQLNAGNRRIMVGASAVTAQADGAVVDFFADGAENHVAQIAPAGAYRVWAEDETGGEAYIPLSPAKRSRSMDILEEVASRFGVAVVGRADGAVDNMAPLVGSSNLNVAATAMFSEDQFARLEAALERGAAVGLAGHEAAADRASRYARGGY